MTSKIFIFLWGIFAMTRRILSIIVFFTPSLGLFSLLHHWKWEQIPFRVRLDYAKRFTITPEDRIGLYGLNETILWSKLDRWDYTNPQSPKAPPYSIYTLMDLKNTFIALLCLSIIQFLAIFFIKYWISAEFCNENHLTNKAIHVFENLHYASPFKDWDHEVCTIQKFKERFRAVRNEMILTFTINIVTTLLMMVPLWFCGKFV